MGAPRKYSDNARERAIRLVGDVRAEDPYLSVNAAVLQVGAKLKIAPGTLRKWVDAVAPTSAAPAAGLTVSAQSGDRLATLRDLRDLIAVTMVKTDSARDVAALSRQLRDVLADIEAVEKAAPEEKGTPLDELEKRRASRKPGTAHRSGAEGGVVAR